MLGWAELSPPQGLEKGKVERLLLYLFMLRWNLYLIKFFCPAGLEKGVKIVPVGYETYQDALQD